MTRREEITKKALELGTTNDTPVCYRKQSSVIHEDTKKIKERDRIYDKVYDLNMQMCDIGKMTHEEKQIHNAVHTELREFEEFKELVKRMREAQVKRFEFYTDDGWWADRAIELEKEVDENLEKMEQAGSSREG